MGMIKAIWQYRGFIFSSVKREFQSKYSNSALGVVWTLIRPLTMILVYTLVFSQLMRTRVPGSDSPFAYSIFLCSGMLTWTFFAEIVGRAETMFLENANLIKKVSFPHLCLPIILVLNASVNFVIIFGLFLSFLVITGAFPGLLCLALVPLLIIQVLFSIGLGMSIGVLNVFFRDVGQLFAVVLQLWFWITPVVYPISILPTIVQKFVRLNPMTPLINGYQVVLANQQVPDWSSLMPAACVALLLCWFGWSLFRKHVGEMVDEL